MIERKQTFIVQKTLVKIKSPKGNCLEARPKSMDEIKCTLVTIKRSKTMDQTKKKKKRKRNTKDNLNVKVSSLRRRGISIGVVLRWLSSSDVFHIDVLKASLKKRIGSNSQVEFNGAKVHFREVFHSIHSKILKPCCIIGIQKISVLLGRLELSHCIFFSLGKKSTQLVVLFL